MLRLVKRYSSGVPFQGSQMFSKLAGTSRPILSTNDGWRPATAGRTFPVEEQIPMDFRAERFNATNRARFNLGLAEPAVANFWRPRQHRGRPGELAAAGPIRLEIVLLGATSADEMGSIKYSVRFVTVTRRFPWV
jgi:hypothetical protein